jgi:alkylation response protein AidB-like acyl-CoA dehydrogenase
MEEHMSRDWTSLVKELGRDFARRAADHDRDDSFVAENYARLREQGVTGAGVPAELGGGGATHAEVCGMIRELSRQCGSTGLAFSMHNHLIATLSYMWRSGNKGPEPLLRRVAAENLILVSTGGADWLGGSGKMEKVEGGWRLNGRKIFCSGVPSGDLMMTMGVHDDPKDGPTVYHFPVSLRAEGVKILDTWHTLGMRGTGSHDVLLENVFLPDASTQGVRRPAGKWHMSMHTVAMQALPIIFSAYTGVAEAARELALGLAARKKDDSNTALAVGEMENQVIAAHITLDSMIALAATAKPGPETTSAMLARRTLVAAACLRAVDKAMEVAGGASFYQSAGLERCFRDVQGARFHPVNEKAQTRLTGRLLLGLDIDG